MNRYTKKKKKGFTLLEILLVIVAIGVLAAVVLVAINPNRQIDQIRATNVKSDLNALYKALEQYNIDNGGIYPESLGLTNELKEICKTGSEEFGETTTDCTNKVDLRALVPTYLGAVPSDTGYTYSIGINEENNKLSLVVNGDSLESYVSINPIYPLIDQVFTTPGTYTYTVPEGVTKISAILVGGGGGGGWFNTSAGFGSGAVTGAGGGGGGLRYATQISTQPGEILTVIAGSGGAVNPFSSGSNGGNSSILRGDNVIVFAEGGRGGPRVVPRGQGFGLGGGGTQLSNTVTGGNGGNGGHFAEWLVNTSTRSWGAGGGGAGGYSGNGGNGGGQIGTQPQYPAQDGNGGAGGGGDVTNWVTGGSGGGVDLFGEGTSGIAGILNGNQLLRSGTGGSGGASGISSLEGNIGNGGNYGGGGGGTGRQDTVPASKGGNGAVRIMWRSASGS